LAERAERRLGGIETVIAPAQFYAWPPLGITFQSLLEFTVV
jgi:hypothetical protein